MKSSTFEDQQTAFWRRLRPMFITAGAVCLLFLGALGSWAAFAPLASAVLAPGIVTPVGSRKTIQHAEGGIIHQMLVREGDEVTKGGQLVVLESTQAKGSYGVAFGKASRLKATRDRLIAQIDSKPELTFGPELVQIAARDEEYKAFLTSQRDLYASVRQSMKEQKAIMERRVLRLNEQVKGLELQIDSAQRQLALTEEEMKDQGVLLERGLARKPQFLALQRSQASFVGQIGTFRTQIQQAQQQAQELRLSIVNLDTEFTSKTTDELTRVTNELAQVEEQLRVSADVLERTTLVAPDDGVVQNIRFKTLGGVIRPGEPILDIVPSNVDLIVEARVADRDVDAVQVGQIAVVNLLPARQRYLPTIEGRVIYVSADAYQEERTGVRYYMAHVEIDRAKIRQQIGGADIQSGMTGDVAIVVEPRTALAYLLQPIQRSFDRSFRER